MVHMACSLAIAIGMNLAYCLVVSRNQPTTEGSMMKSMIAVIHPHTATKHRPTQQWAAYDMDGAALGYAHNLDKLVAYLKERGYSIIHETCTRGC